MRKVLFVEDDPTLADAACRLLGSEGCVVAFAATRGQGLRSVTDDPPDVVVLDAALDESQDGLSLAHELRARGFDRPVVLLTTPGGSGSAPERPAEPPPVDAFLVKPVDPERLVNAIDCVLGSVHH